jgi:hypothetical protein
MGRIGSPETSFLNQPTMPNNPEDGRIQQSKYSEFWNGNPFKNKPIHFSL